MEDVFKFERKSSGGDSLEVTGWGRFVTFEIDSPWYGSTEQGFGARLQINVPPVEIVKLRDALSKWLESVDATADYDDD